MFSSWRLTPLAPVISSGSGRDCYVASALVGSKGSVVGVDMTDEQLEVARAHVDDWTVTLGYRKPNMRFVAGQIEDLRTAGITGARAPMPRRVLPCRAVLFQATDLRLPIIPSTKSSVSHASLRLASRRQQHRPHHLQLRCQPRNGQARRLAGGVPRPGRRRRVPFQRRVLRSPPACGHPCGSGAGWGVPRGASVVVALPVRYALCSNIALCFVVVWCWLVR